MIKTAGRATPILNYIVIFFLFALFVLQCLPFWTNADAVQTSPTKELREVSIQEFTWFCTTKKPASPGNDMTKYFQRVYGSKWQSADIVLMPVIIVACCIITIFFGIKKPTRLWMNIVYLTAGIVGIWGYLSDPIFQLNDMYIVHIVVCALIIVSSLLNITVRPWKKVIHFMKTGE